VKESRSLLSRLRNDPEAIEAYVVRVGGPVMGAAVGLAVVLTITAAPLGPVVALSVAAMLAELGGLAIVARWLRGPHPTLFRLRVTETPTPGGARAGGGVIDDRPKGPPPPPTLEQRLARLEGRVDALRAGADREERALRRRIDELERSLTTRIREESSDPTVGLLLIAVGAILSACANIVGA
jgi:hypothetical protein